MNDLTKVTIIVSVFFLILFTASAAFQNVLTKIFEEEGDTEIAPFNFMINYSFFMIGNLFAPVLKFSHKRVMMVSALCYSLKYGLGFFMFSDNVASRYAFTGLGGAVCGIAASFLWVSVGKYIHNACHLYKKENEKGHYFGMFNFIYSLSMVIGGVVATFGLGLLSHVNYFFFVTGISIFSFFFGFFFIKDIQYEEEEIS